MTEWSRRLAGAGLITAAWAAAPALAAPPPVIAGIDAQDEIITAHVLIASDPGGAPVQPPERIDAILHAGGQEQPVLLVRESATVLAIAVGGWATIDYRATRPAGAAGPVVLSLGGSAGGYAFALAPSGTAVASAAPRAGPSPAAAPAPPASVGARPGNVFLANLSTYQPIYAVLGHGTDTNARLQISFKYQLLGTPGDGKWWDGFHFAYTQGMFWDLRAHSKPFRDVNYQPEFLYIYRHPPSASGFQWGAQGGFLHQSNGRGGAASRGINIVYAEPQAHLPLGDWELTVAPRIWAYVIGRDGNPDIARYRGHQSLAFSIGQEDGLKLSTDGRFGFGSGKGAIEGELSYPLDRFWKPLPLYIMVQGFTGYGEDLLDYNRKQTRLRVGLGIVR